MSSVPIPITPVLPLPFPHHGKGAIDWQAILVSRTTTEHWTLLTSLEGESIWLWLDPSYSSLSKYLFESLLWDSLNPSFAFATTHPKSYSIACPPQRPSRLDRNESPYTALLLHAPTSLNSARCLTTTQRNTLCRQETAICWVCIDYHIAKERNRMAQE